MEVVRTLPAAQPFQSRLPFGVQSQPVKSSLNGNSGTEIERERALDLRFSRTDLSCAERNGNSAENSNAYDK